MYIYISLQDADPSNTDTNAKDTKGAKNDEETEEYSEEESTSGRPSLDIPSDTNTTETTTPPTATTPATTAVTPNTNQSEKKENDGESNTTATTTTTAAPVPDIKITSETSTSPVLLRTKSEADLIESAATTPPRQDCYR